MSSFSFLAHPPKMFNVCKNMCRRKTFALIISVSTKFFTRVQNIILQAFQTQSLLSTGRKCSWVWTFWSQARRFFSCLGSLQWMWQLKKVWEWLLPSIITKEGERGHGWELEFPKNDFLHLTWLISNLMNENLAFAAKLKTPGKINLKFYKTNDVSLTLLVKTMHSGLLSRFT